LREATARYEPDYTLSEESVETKPRRRRKTVSPAAARAAENRARLLAALRYTADNPVKVLGTACLAVAAISFTINALFFQQGRHPAPLFAPKSEIAATTPASSAAAPAPATQIVALPPGRPADLPVKKDTPAQTAAAPQGRDAIGDLLRGGVVSTPVADPKQEQVRSVASVQRALNRLGYGPVKADGIFGSGTKLALERFERDRKLPVSGEMSPRILKELAAASGIAFD
jgi:hypothetical protein